MRGFDRIATDLTAELRASAAAEIEVVVVAQSGSYRAADFLVGFQGAGLAQTIAASLFERPSLAVFMPAAVIGFVAFAVVGAHVPLLRRSLVELSGVVGQALVHARATFVAQGLDRAEDGRGLLVYASRFEREVHVLAGPGLASTTVRGSWTKAAGELEAAWRGGDPDAFAAAVRRLGALVAHDHPARDRASAAWAHRGVGAG